MLLMFQIKYTCQSYTTQDVIRLISDTLNVNVHERSSLIY